MGEIYKYADLKGMAGFSVEGLTPIFHRFLMILLPVCMGSPLLPGENAVSTGADTMKIKTKVRGGPRGCGPGGTVFYYDLAE